MYIWYMYIFSVTTAARITFTFESRAHVQFMRCECDATEWYERNQQFWFELLSLQFHHIQHLCSSSHPKRPTRRLTPSSDVVNAILVYYGV